MLQQIVAHQPIPSPRPQKDFLFCPDGSDLARRIDKARENLVLHDSPRRNASFARSLAQILRQKHQHTAHCSACILREVFGGKARQ